MFRSAAVPCLRAAVLCVLRQRPGRPADPQIGARSFLGMFVVNVVAREIMRDPSAVATPDEQLVATVLDIFLGGLEIVEG